MLSFRQKIFLSYLAIFLIFTIFLYPVAATFAARIQENNLKKRAKSLVNAIDDASSENELIELLRKHTAFLFYRVTLLDSEKNFLFDSHPQLGLSGIEYPDITLTPEIAESLKNGFGYDVRYSSTFGEEIAYVAIPFQFQGKKYIMRALFPYGEISNLTDELSLSFLIIGVCMLLLFSFLAWFIIHFLTRPVKQIIEAIKPYQLGQEEHLQEIHLAKGIGPRDEFGKLAETLNSLTRRIQSEINTLTQERNEKGAILESLIEGVIAVDRDMNVIYMNRMAAVFLDIKEKKLVGKAFHLAKQPICEELLKKAQLENEPVVTVLKPERKQKRFFDVVAVPRGKNEGAILVLQDKTGLHKVIERGKDFIANASHELKTPITIIRGFAETLHEHPELSPEVNREITEKIVSNCQRMDTLVKNLLTLAAVDEGLPRSRLQECDMVALVEEAKQTILTIHPNANIIIESKGEEPLNLMADSDLFLQAILNLLDNAVKYSPPPAQVHAMIEKKEKEFIIQISDKGKGIPKEDLDRIFERFYAVDKSHSRSLGGSGLGLSIVERIIEKHQGKIDVKSTLGKGTTFTITLPIHDDEAY